MVRWYSRSATVGRRPPSAVRPSAQSANGTQSVTGSAVRSPAPLTSMTGARNAYRAQSSPGVRTPSRPPRIGPHRAESSCPQMRWRLLRQPENRPPSSGELAAIATITGPSACANRIRSAHPVRGPASTFTCIDAVEVIIADPAAAVPLAAKNVSIAR